MDEATRSALAELNRVFYAGFAADFARTRRSWPPGFERILPHLRPAANVLDVGCGNGRLLAFLIDRGWRGRYLGLDSSSGLLAEAAKVASHGWAGIDADEPAFIHADLLSPAWPALVGAAPAAIALLAVLHHLPGADQRGRLVAQCAGLLAPGGVLIVSTWQFLGAPRLRARLLPWALAGLRDEDVEPDDYLVAWGSGAAGRRYCAAIGEDALRGLAARAGLTPVAFFYADGHEGNLNLYGVFTAT